MNTFKVGDRVTVKSIKLATCVNALQNTTQDKVYTITKVGTWAEDTTVDEPTAICFMDDRNDEVTVRYANVTLVTS